uniref:Bifunctional cytochrome P450/NADPH--P450 reductase n=1 Tax=Fusarium oxysporum TaxID=5507 RepID=C505_FUSOX|nr:RecName: Full=Bifunctional cytochrome P450/NADPH--P450 reductase; AltName: Full=Cytochrome P450foxy; AltName: Full=Fatty acid omega-hydroxylase; AltName: Full=P450foxy; Includes: RecName: Full=Cytochrome P450 505; Includes: RecName: Full=NADPH--cytochrome P450 reductase [Fusarium oxysporum]BAA82526.1 fatty acid omega-hydroxylase (P450foxy) [Fusarium oxysporum]
MAESVPIPEPPGYPLIGNLGEFTSNPLSDLNRLADTYGPIFRLRLGAKAPIFVSSNSLINEVCDEKRFKKTLKSVLSQVREGVHDGLFTAFEDEPNWGKAHRILVPAFGPLSIRGMFPEMHDIATQLCMKFARHGPRTPIDTSDNFTRLALDTLALCAMDFRFYSYYKEELHPFIEAMGDFLTESGNRNRRPPFAPNFLYRAANEKFYGDIALMKSVADEVVAARKASPSDRKDLLAAMLNGVDPQTGEKLSDENITNQLITFLIAGHETTSGTLSFAMYQLLKNPEAYSKVQKEVDEVVGRGPVLVEHLTKLPYISAVLRETLRLNSPITAFGLEAIDDTFLGGKYLVKKGEIVTALLSRGHVDPVVYGNDADKFIPERMLDDEFARLNKEYPNCWKPFGNGKRACIGRPFAWQESLLAMVVLFQNFNFTMTDPNYALEIKQTLTIKPDHFYINATLRHGMTPTELEHVLAGNGATSSSTHNIKAAANLDAKAGSGKPMAIFYGSNSGTCEALANRLASDAPSHGFSATTVGPLDQAKQNLPEDRPVVIVTASYEGQPPSNAAHFIKWMEDLDGNDMEKVSYAVFACGHHDWVETFHRIPKLVDSTLEKRGGTRLVPMGSADAATSDMFSDFEAWEDIVLWPGLKEKYKISDEESGGQKGLLVEVSTPRKTSLRQDVEEALVVAEKTLTKSGPAKKHIEIQLPSAMTYKAGDYLAILPLNPKSTVARVFRRFSLAWDSFLKIQSEGPTTLPTNVAISAFDVFSAYVELSQPATKRNILALAEATEDKDTIQELERLAGDAYQAEISPKRVSVLDLLEKFPAVALPISSYLAMLPPMRVRQYSISSSPFADPSKLTLTYSLLDAPSLSGQGRHVGVATNFLSHLTAGDKLHVSVRASSEAFHLPSDAEKTPIICVAAGTGLAPLRGFIQERAAMLAAGRTLAPALLFFGCRNPEIDDLYAEEFERWEKMGAVDVRRAYSRATDKSEGCKYVQDRVYHDRADVFKVWDQGAKVFICGSREIGKAVEDVCVRLAIEKAQQNGRDVTEEMARAWFERSRNERFATDVFD